MNGKVKELPAANTTISHYRILSRLGAGGMGEVYLAEDTQLDRKVAIKFLPPESVADEQAKKRLVREAKAAAKLDHPNICSIHEVGESEDRSFIVMQYVEGETLASRITHQPLQISEALDIAVQIADALAEAHTHGIIHRDIKPHNIMITARGQAKLMDFGLARVAIDRSLVVSDAETETLLTAPGVMVGTVPYMSPEQVKGRDLDARSDIFSFAVVMYEMLSGQRPFAAENAAATCSEILSRKQAPLARYCRDVPAELERMIDKALNKDREERYQTARDLLIDLRSLKNKLAVEADAARSGEPASAGTALPVTTGENSAAATVAPVTTTTQEIKGQSAGRFNYRWLGISAAAILAIGVAAYFALFNRAAALTEKDSILLADFVNTTGDNVFDPTLKQALAVQLGQSPFLNIVPDDRIRETLKFMGRSPDDRVTKELAREICERQGLKALLSGSIAGLGSHYVILLEATNAHSGENIAREQVEAENKEEVLRKLGEAASRLREKLGESLSTIQRFDAPIEQATTSSLEALRALSLGTELGNKGATAEAIPFLKRAVELDPNFALAYAKLSTAHSNLRQYEQAAEFSQKAFDLRDRTSEREKLLITMRYYGDVTGDMEKTNEVLEVWKQTYPRDHVPPGTLSALYILIGQYEKGIEEARQAIQLNPNNAAPHVNIGGCLMRLNHFDEAKAVLEQAMAKKLEAATMHFNLYIIAFMQGDQAAMQQQADWAKGKTAEPGMLYHQATATASSGQLRKAGEFTGRAVDLAVSHNAKELAAAYVSGGARTDALFGDCRRLKEVTAKALAIARSKEALVNAAFALALCGEMSQAQPLIDELARRFPGDTFINVTWLPTIRAIIEINRNDPAQAIQLLQVASRYEFGNAAALLPAYVRGLAYLRQRAGAEAMAEFQKILDHRGVVGVFPHYPLAQLGLARAAALAGDTAKSRRAYQDFFALWKDADPDIPILIEAKREYEKVK